MRWRAAAYAAAISSARTADRQTARSLSSSARSAGDQAVRPATKARIAAFASAAEGRGGGGGWGCEVLGMDSI